MYTSPVQALDDLPFGMVLEGLIGALDHRRVGGHVEGPGLLGGLESGTARLQPTGEADGERVRRGIQLVAQARVLMATLPYRRGGRPASPRPMAG